jgi:hypothetical protein
MGSDGAQFLMPIRVDVLQKRPKNWMGAATRDTHS